MNAYICEGNLSWVCWTLWALNQQGRGCSSRDVQIKDIFENKEGLEDVTKSLNCRLAFSQCNL